MSRIDRIRGAVPARRAQRTDTDRPQEAGQAFTANLPVPVSEPVTIERPMRVESRGGDSEFTAQLLGQDGQRRGLRAGPTLIETARSAYNRVEWSGSYDRRRPTGGRTRADI